MDDNKRIQSLAIVVGSESLVVEAESGGPIKPVWLNGHKIPWFRQGNVEYNGAHVVKITYYA